MLQVCASGAQGTAHSLPCNQAADGMPPKFELMSHGPVQASTSWAVLERAVSAWADDI